MSLLTSLSSGTTGLQAASSELSVISDNLANANTVGFKAERAAFEDALAQSVINGEGQIGLGARMQGVQRMVTQGSLSNTGVATDLALQGAGFFYLRGSAANGRSGNYLTRAGQFTVDNEGYLVSLNGLRVQGYGADSSGQIASPLGDVQVGNSTSQPHATDNITIKANLNVDSPVPPAFDPASPIATSSFVSGVTVYDSLGKEYPVQLYFRNNGLDAGSSPPTSTWQWHAMVDGALVGGTAGTPTDIANGTLQFDAEGRLLAVPPATSNFTPVGAAAQTLTFNFGDPISGGGTGLGGVTQFSSTSAATFIGQDGFSSGQLTGVSVDKRGMVYGSYSNGQNRVLGQVAVARLAAPDKMERVGGNLYAATRASGEAVLGTAGEGGRAFISSGALEQSTVDIAEQFVRMIAAQRAFEANSKTITTSDQLLSELIQMKR